MTRGRPARYVTRVPVTVHMEAVESQLAALLGIDLSLLLRKAFHQEINSRIERGEIHVEEHLAQWIAAQRQQKTQIEEKIRVAEDLLQHCRLPNRGTRDDGSGVLPGKPEKMIWVYDDNVEEKRRIPESQFDPASMTRRKGP